MQTLRRPTRVIALASILATGLMAATPALADKTPHDPKGKTYVFDFTGTCSDCDGVGTGVLTLAGVTDLSALTTGNFVDFTYSSNLAGDIDITDISVFTGNFSDLSQVIVDIEGSTAPPSGCAEKACPQPKGSPTSYVFETSTTLDGPGWSLSTDKGGGKPPKNTDFGADYSWTAASVPEPVSWALMIAGFGLAGARLRLGRRGTA